MTHRLIPLLFVLVVGCGGLKNPKIKVNFPPPNVSVTERAKFVDGKIVDNTDYVVQYSVERLFMHNVGTYSCLVKDGTELVALRFYVPGRERLIADVPPNKPMYVQAVFSAMPQFIGIRPKGEDCREVEYHIHSASEVNGGGWQGGGKNSASGNTVIIE